MTEPDSGRYRGGRVPSDDDQGEGRALGNCSAHGCPLPASINLGGGWACSAHALMAPAKWQDTTTMLRRCWWLIDLMRRLQEPDLHSTWAAYAQHACRDDPDAAPVKGETRELYAHRLHLEVMWRAGARKERPTPRVPVQQRPNTSLRGSEAALAGLAQRLLPGREAA